MPTPIVPTADAARTDQPGDDKLLEEMPERLRAELLLAEDLTDEHADGTLAEFCLDPCHFLRRACQVADYGTAAEGKSSGLRASSPS